MKGDWYNVHLDGLNQVDRDIGIGYYCSCGIPGSFNILKSNEVCS